MAQKTEILQVRVNEDIRHYLDVLEKKYRFKRCDFVRIAIIEKLQRDVPKLRKEYLKKDTPF